MEVGERLIQSVGSVRAEGEHWDGGGGAKVAQLGRISRISKSTELPKRPRPKFYTV